MNLVTLAAFSATMVLAFQALNWDRKREIDS